MKTFEITKEQILELANESSFTKATLNKMFPQAFESELEVGKWYKYNKFLLYIIDETHWYGFDCFGEWNDYVEYEYLMTDKDLTPATDKEVETALIAEAKRRGFKEGVKVKRPDCFCNKGVITIQDNSYSLFGETIVGFQIGGYSVFENGKWAEIISEPLTLEQRIERIEEQLKIKK